MEQACLGVDVGVFRVVVRSTFSSRDRDALCGCAFQGLEGKIEQQRVDVNEEICFALRQSNFDNPFRSDGLVSLSSELFVQRIGWTH